MSIRARSHTILIGVTCDDDLHPSLSPSLSLSLSLTHTHTPKQNKKKSKVKRATTTTKYLKDDWTQIHFAQPRMLHRKCTILVHLSKCCHQLCQFTMSMRHLTQPMIGKKQTATVNFTEDKTHTLRASASGLASVPFTS